MTYFTDLHSYLHQSSLLVQAYPSTRITTKYSLPRKVKQTSTSKSQQQPAASDSQADTGSSRPKREPREPAATLTLKTFHPDSGICLKYQTDKAAEVGRLMSGLGRLAKGEVIEMPSSGAGAGAGDLQEADRMEVDGASAIPAVEQQKTATQMTQQQQGGGGGASKKKKKSKK